MRKGCCFQDLAQDLKFLPGRAADDTEMQEIRTGGLDCRADGTFGGADGTSLVHAPRANIGRPTALHTDSMLLYTTAQTPLIMLIYTKMT